MFIKLKQIEFLKLHHNSLNFNQLHEFSTFLPTYLSLALLSTLELFNIYICCGCSCQLTNINNKPCARLNILTLELDLVDRRVSGSQVVATRMKSRPVWSSLLFQDKEVVRGRYRGDTVTELGYRKATLQELIREHRLKKVQRSLKCRWNSLGCVS